MAGKIISQSLTQLFEFPFVELTRQLHDTEEVPVNEFCDDRPLSVSRKGRDRVDSRLDLIGEPLGWVTRQRLDNDLTHSLRGCGANLFDTVEIVNRLLDPNTDLFLNLPRACPGKGHGNTDAINDRRGEKLLIETGYVV